MSPEKRLSRVKLPLELREVIGEIDGLVPVEVFSPVEELDIDLRNMVDTFTRMTSRRESNPKASPRKRTQYHNPDILARVGELRKTMTVNQTAAELGMNPNTVRWISHDLKLKGEMLKRGGVNFRSKEELIAFDQKAKLLYERGLPQKEMTEVLGVNKTTLVASLRRLVKSGEITRNRRGGRPKNAMGT
jgi:hypothetical protein